MAEETKKPKSNKRPPMVGEKISVENSRIGNEAGAIIFQTNIKSDSYSSIPEDTSFIQLEDKWGSYLNMHGGKLLLKASSEMSQYVDKDFFQFVGGDVQVHIYGDKNEYVHGHYNVQAGKQNKEQIEAATRLNEIADDISNSTIKEIEANVGKGDKVACQVCGIEVDVDRASQMVGTAFKYIRKIFSVLPNSPFGGTLDKVQKFISGVAGFFLNTTTTAACNGGTCGSSACKNGMVASPLYAIQKGNEKAAAKFEEHKKEIEKLEKNLPSECGTVSIPNTLHKKVGTSIRKAEVVAYHDPVPEPTELQNGKTQKWGFIPYSFGTCKKAIYTPPTITNGIDFAEIGGSLDRVVGSGGINFDTCGRFYSTASTVAIVANKGEALFSSPNKTIIAGANIVLETKGNHNGDAIILNSDRVYVGGKLSVQGDLALKGSLMMDGGIFVPHITCPGERIDTDVSSSAHNCHSNANWNNPMTLQATTLSIFDRIYKVLRDICASLVGLVMSPDYLKTKIEETYAYTMVSITIDGNGLPTGFAMLYEYTTYMPIMAYGTCTMGGLVTAYVQPSMIPIYNWTHVHGSPGDPHVHAYTALKSVTHGSSAASIASRPPANAIPTAAQAQGMGTPPGHKNAGELGPCGGGGGYFGNPKRVNSSNLRRNQQYGFDGPDAFDGNDYVNITPKFTEDGELIPTPTLNILEC